MQWAVWLHSMVTEGHRQSGTKRSHSTVTIITPRHVKPVSTSSTWIQAPAAPVTTGISIPLTMSPRHPVSSITFGLWPLVGLVLYSNTALGARSFSVASPKMWNSLPPALHSCNCTDTFCRGTSSLITPSKPFHPYIYTLWTEKHIKMCFWYTVYKTWPIVIIFGTYYE